MSFFLTTEGKIVYEPYALGPNNPVPWLWGSGGTTKQLYWVEGVGWTTEPGTDTTYQRFEVDPKTKELIPYKPFDFATATPLEKLEEALRQVPQYASENAKERLRELLTPANIKSTAAQLLALLAIQGTPFGQLVDGLLATATLMLKADEKAKIAADLAEGAATAATATTPEQHKEGTKQLATGLSLLVLLAFAATTAWMAGKGEGRTGSGKNEPHGRQPGTKLKEQLDELEDQLRELNRTQGSAREKARIRQKIININKQIERIIKGETHHKRGQ